MSKMYDKKYWNCVLSASLTLILLSTVTPPVHCCWGSTSTKLGEMTPDQKLLDGSPLVIDCSLNNNTIEYENKRYKVNSSMIAFKFKQQFYRKDRIHLISNTVSRILVEKASESDGGDYYCLLNLSGLSVRPLICLTHVTVGYKPQNVTDFKCISLHYRKLHCSWTPPQNPIPTTYTLEDKYHAFKDHPLTRKCGDSPSVNSCEWTTETQPPYRNTALKFNLLLTGVNQFGNYSEPFVIDHYSIIKPNIPKSFGTTEVTTTMISLSWKPPEYIEYDEELLEHIIYEIRYFSQIPDKKDKSQTIILDGIRENSFNLTDLVPYLAYNISIRCKTTQSKSDEYWGEFSSIVVQTKADVPYLAPELIPESFQTDKNMEGLRTITLFWKQIEAQYRNGPEFHYLIKYNELMKRKSRAINLIHEYEDSLQFESQNTTYIFNHMKSDVAYEFTIFGVNRKGISSNYSRIMIERNEEIPHKPSNIDVYSYGGGRYELQWTKPRQSSMSGNIFNYTVFWCQNLRPRPFLCEGAIDWKQTKNTSIALELPDITGTNYQFAVSANALKASSGMSWAECIVPIDSRLEKLSEVQLKVLNSTAIVVNWKLNCPAQKRVVERYKIKYCATDENKKPCLKSESVTVDNSVENYILNNLEPYTYYRITATAYSGDTSPSEESDPRYEQTSHDSPEDSPSELEVTDTTSHSIGLMWRIPVKANGHISHYNIHCDDRVHSLKAQKCNESHCFFTIKNLLSYQTYKIRVSACNNEALCSPDSNVLPVLTSMSVPNIMDPPRSESINSTTVRIAWSPPIHPSGPINSYLIRLIRTNNITKEYNVSGKSLEFFVTIDCESIEDNTDSYHSQYSVQLSSENILGNGKHLIAEYSEPTNLNACLGLPPYNFGYIIGIIVGAASGLLVLVLVLVSLARWMKRRINSIRNIHVELPKGLEDPVLITNPDREGSQPYDPFGRSDSFTNIGMGAIGDNHSINKNRHGSGLSQQSSDDSTEALYNKTTIKMKDSFFRLTSNESGQSGQLESVSSSAEAHMSSDSGTENDIQLQNNDMKDVENVNKMSLNSPLSILDEISTRNSDSSGSKDSGLDINSKELRSKKPTKRKPNIKTKLSSIVKPTPDRNEVMNPLYDSPMSHSVCIYSLLANSEPSLFDIPVREDDNILSDLTKFSKPEMAKSLSNIIQNYSPSDPKVNCIICETNSSSRCSTRTSSPNCPYYKYGIKRQNHNQNSFVPNFSPEKKKGVNVTKANNGYIALDCIQNVAIKPTTDKSSQKRLEHDWSQNSYDAEVSSTSSNGDNEQTDVLLSQNNSLKKSCLSFAECEKIQNKIQNNPSFEDNNELNVIDSSVYPLNTSSNDLVIEFEPQLIAIKEINNFNERTSPLKTTPTHLAKDSNGYVLHNALNQLTSVNPLKPNLIKNANGYVVLDAVHNGIEMTDYVPKENVVNHVTQV